MFLDASGLIGVCVLRYCGGSDSREVGVDGSCDIPLTCLVLDIACCRKRPSIARFLCCRVALVDPSTGSVIFV